MGLQKPTLEGYGCFRIKYDQTETVAYESGYYPFVRVKIGEPTYIIVYKCPTFEHAKWFIENIMCTVQKIIDGAPCFCESCVVDNPILKIMAMVDIKSYYPAPR